MQIQLAEKKAQAKPTDPPESYNLVWLYAFYGRTELAYQWLTKTLAQGYKAIGYLRSDPALISIREERDFQLLLNLLVLKN